jgi:hypothetical protein
MEKNKSSGLIVAAVIVGVVLYLAVRKPADDDTKSSNATPEMMAAIQEAEASRVVEAPKPIQRTHYYAMEEDGEYGYESGLSDEDKKQGRAVKAMILTRYLGEKDGVHTVRLADDPAMTIFSCKSPCEFIKSKTYYAGTLIKTETLRNTEGSVIWAVMQDAQNGDLVRYSKKMKAAAS